MGMEDLPIHALEGNLWNKSLNLNVSAIFGDPDSLKLSPPYPKKLPIDECGKSVGFYVCVNTPVPWSVLGLVVYEGKN